LVADPEAQMPVVFLCHSGRSRLSVSRRKIGAQVDCPRCRLPLTVPAEESAAATVAMAEVNEASKSAEDVFPEFAVFDDPLPSPPPPLPPTKPPPREAAPAKEKPAPAASAPSDPPAKQDRQAPPRRRDTPSNRPTVASNGASTAEIPAQRTAGPSPAEKSPPTQTERKSSRHSLGVLKPENQPSSYRDVLLIRRRTLYLQAVLICLMAGIGLVGGYYVGRAMGPVERKPPAVDPGVQIAGTLTFRNTPGEEAPDSGAVVIVLPADVPSERVGKVVAMGLGPQSRREHGRAAEMAIEELGGKYERTDGLGNFSLNLPKAGRYQLLFISRSLRPAGQGVSATHLKEMQRYFAAPAEVIGPLRYAWVTRDVRDPRLVVLHTF
jgi:hypothetical protein